MLRYLPPGGESGAKTGNIAAHIPGVWGIELVGEPRHAPVIRDFGCLTSTVLRYLANRAPNPAQNPDIAAHYFEAWARVSVGGIRSAGANIGKRGWTPAGAIVCAAFCGMSARIQGRNLRYRSTVGEMPEAPPAGGKGGALGVRLALVAGLPRRGPGAVRRAGRGGWCREVGVDKRK